jgi:ketosteroid isomerase-like protein
MIGAIILKSMLDRTGTDQINQRNVGQLLSHWTDDATLIYPGNLPFSGEMRGKAMLTAFFEIYLEQFPELEFKTQNSFIKNMFAIGTTNTLAIETAIKYTNRWGYTFENTVTSILELRQGKVYYDKDYYFDVDTLNKAWEGADLDKLEKFLSLRG